MYAQARPCPGFIQSQKPRGGRGRRIMDSRPVHLHNEILFHNTSDHINLNSNVSLVLGL